MRHSSFISILKLVLSLLLLSCSATDATPTTRSNARPATAGQLRHNIPSAGRAGAFLRQCTFASAAISSVANRSQDVSSGRYREINHSFINRKDDDNAQRKDSTTEDDSPLVRCVALRTGRNTPGGDACARSSGLVRSATNLRKHFHSQNFSRPFVLLSLLAYSFKTDKQVSERVGLVVRL